MLLIASELIYSNDGEYCCKFRKLFCVDSRHVIIITLISVKVVTLKLQNRVKGEYLSKALYFSLKMSEDSPRIIGF